MFTERYIPIRELAIHFYRQNINAYWMPEFRETFKKKSIIRDYYIDSILSQPINLLCFHVACSGDLYGKEGCGSDTFKLVYKYYYRHPSVARLHVTDNEVNLLRKRGDIAYTDISVKRSETKVILKIMKKTFEGSYSDSRPLSIFKKMMKAGKTILSPFAKLVRQ